MRNLIVVIVAVSGALVLPAGACAAPGAFIPPSNPSAYQYVEVIPTTSGSLPSSSITAQDSGASKGVSRTVSTLEAHGPDGARAAALALAGAPPSPARGHRSASRRRPGSGGPGSSGRSEGGGGSGGGGASGGGSSPVASLARSIIGSGTPGGLGAVLPLVLVVCVLVLAAFAAGRAAGLRRRRSSS